MDFVVLDQGLEDSPYGEQVVLARDINPSQQGRAHSSSRVSGINQITVAIRKRPLSQKEIKKKEIDVVTVSTRDNITIHEPKCKVDLTKYLDNQHFR